VGRGHLPGEFEQVVLLTLAGFDGEVRGRDVYEALVHSTGRDVSVAAVHITLGRLEEKGWATCRTSQPEPGRGGKPRRHYALSEAGAAVLTEIRRQLDGLWEAAQANPLIGRSSGR
jgi:DNA-binding PadR family transcriptional regulator